MKQETPLAREEIQNLDTRNYEDYTAIITQSLTVPDNFSLSSVRERIRNDEPIYLFRYSPLSEGEVLGGSHFSVMMHPETKEILGFALMSLDSQTTLENTLPSEAETETYALQFLESFNPSIIPTLKHTWTKQHDETMNQDVIISGMKYKNYVPSTDSYTWIVVDYRGEIIAFEQGMLWDNGPATTQWLRDGVLVSENGN